MAGFGGYNEEFIAAEGAGPVALPELPKPKTPEEAANLDPGTEFIDPTGKKKIVPYRPSDPEEAAALPEGATFITPEGKTKRMPVYQGVGFTAQLLHDMALTDEGREEALRTMYGDKVKRGPQGLYVQDDDDVFRKPDSRGLAASAGHAVSEAAPLAGMTAGAVIGAGAGSLEPGAGTALGGFLGMTMGAAAGRAVNNGVLALAGIHESFPAQLKSEETEAALAATGEVAGKVISKIPGVAGAVKRGVEAGKEKVGGIKENLAGTLEALGVTPERARWILGTPLEEAQQASRISEAGGRTPPSAVFHEAPYLSKIEEFDAVFRQQNVLAEANEKYYNQEVRKIAESPEIGASIDQILTQAEKKVSSERAGHLSIAAAQKDLAHDDAQIVNAVNDVRDIAKGQIEAMGGRQAVSEAFQHRLNVLNAAHKTADESAKHYINAQVSRLHEKIDEALAMTKKGEDPSAALRATAAEFKLWEKGVRQRASKNYTDARAAAGGAKLDVSSLSDDAAAFLQSMPEMMRSKYPSEIRDLERLAGSKEMEFDEVHKLRSWFRHGIDYNDMTPDMRTGALKLFEKKINTLLHDTEARPELKTAVEMLDRADAFYKQEIPFFNDEMITGVINALKSGVGANPEALAKILFDPNRTAALRRVRSIVGENLWNAVQSAHVNDMLMKSRTIDGRIDATKFAQFVHDDVKNNLISTAYTPQVARQVTAIAQDVAKLEGKLPITFNEGDTLTTLMNRTKAAKEAAEKFAENDPLKAFDQEMKNLDKELQGKQKQMAQARKQAPLSFLEDPKMSHMAVKAADKILGSQDLIMAAADKFGRDSIEFNALRQVYTVRFFQRAFGRTAGMRAELGGEKGMTEEVQALMFPGVTRGQMLQIVHDMEFLFGGRGGDVGGAMAAAARVLNPTAHLPLPKLGLFGRILMGTPGIAFATRFALGKAYATIIDGVTHPNFMAWLAGNLNGNATQRSVARAVLQHRMAMGGWLGAVGTQLAGNPASGSDQ